ncbi:MAG: aldo/keto reductase, partial [Hyphomicrobiales bacterium]
VADELMGIAYDAGVNFFDNAEGYAEGHKDGYDEGFDQGASPRLTCTRADTRLLVLLDRLGHALP